MLVFNWCYVISLLRHLFDCIGTELQLVTVMFVSSVCCRARLTSLLQTLERLLSREEGHEVPRFSADDYQQLRLLTSRILQNVSSQGHRQLLLGFSA